MKKKKEMKQRILAVILAVIMLIPYDVMAFSSGTGTDVTDADVFTDFTADEVQGIQDEQPVSEETQETEDVIPEEAASWEEMQESSSDNSEEPETASEEILDLSGDTEEEWEELPLGEEEIDELSQESEEPLEAEDETGDEISQLEEEMFEEPEMTAGNVNLPGDGTQDSPYQISSEADLQELAKSGETTYIGGYYTLMNDVEITGNLSRIGIDSSKAFKGVFDGQGYTISGLTIADGTGATGLFGYNAGTIRNLKVSGSVYGTGATGILAGTNAGTISNCEVSGTVSSNADHGGLVGENSSSSSVITECFSSAEVNGNGTAGGLAGSNGGIIRYSGAVGKVTGGSGYTGGLVGYNRAVIENSYAQGTVTGNGDTGGFVGRNYEANAKITCCYASGSVNSNGGAGFAGERKWDGKLRFCYFNSENTGNRSGIPVTISQLKRQNTYSGWDFEHIWAISEDGYPVISLRGEIPEVQISGDGSEDNPYVIMTEEQLVALAQGRLPLASKSYYVLGADIALTAGNWTPIGGNGYSDFNGVFDGQNHTVSGLKLSGQDGAYEGLFGRNTGVIKNLIVNGTVESTGEAGILAGENAGTIENCRVSGTVESTGNHGGLVGGNVSAGVVSGSTAAVSVNGTGTAGGFVGNNSGGSIRYSGAVGKVTGGNSYTGGFAGYNSSVIENSYAQGAVTGTGTTGGFVGRNYESKAQIACCYASGMVNDNTGAGFAGDRQWDKLIRFSYFNSANTGNRAGIPASSAQMKQQGTYSGWDFEHIWVIEGGYPVIDLRGEIPEIEISGDGSEDNPYVIMTEEQLTALAREKLPLASKNYYVLGADIALTAGNWTPIGGNGYSNFNGVFDGQNHTISGLKLSGQDGAYEGLFGRNKGVIKNLIVNGTVESAGEAGILAGENAGTIENCRVSGTVESTGNHGGLVGGNVSAGVVSGSTAAVSVNGTGTAGGFVGSNNGGIIRCSGATGKVTGGNSYTGGFAGYNNSVIENSYARGTVTGTGTTGGFVGKNYESNAQISCCYASGMVNDNTGAGFAGDRQWDKLIRFSYFNSANTGNRAGIPASSAQLKQQGTYSGWDFEHVWAIEGGYPVIDLRGEIPEIEISGDGSEENPYVIMTEEQLVALAQEKLPLSGGMYYTLGADIVLTAINWAPIGGNGYSDFNGVFDGQSHTISGLKLSGQDGAYEGLFGRNTGVIKNLIVNGTVESVGEAGILAGENAGTIENCRVSGTVESTGDHGGLVGYNISAGVVSGSTAAVSVNGTGTAGGFAGNNNGIIRYSGATGKVTGGNGYTGGFAGYNTAVIENSYAQGAVTGTGYTGGFVGRNYETNAKITYCYASGKVNSNTGAGFAGDRRWDKLIRFSYFNSANTENRVGIPVSATQLKQQGTYSGWDFEHVWVIEESYPVIDLRGEIPEIQISGDGSEKNPYVIMTEQQLVALAQDKLPLASKAYYALGADIALTAVNWTPIGGNGYSDFNGVFDGQNHAISGLKLSGQDGACEGLFGRNTGVIKNLIVNGTVESAGEAGILAGENAGTIENCRVSGTVESTGDHGGLVGYNISAGVVSGSTAAVSVNGTGTAGGFAGNNNGVIRYSGAAGKVTGGNGYTGGFAGYNTSVIENSYAQGAVTGTGNTGGFVGRNYETNAKITYCYASGKVNSNTGAGFAGDRRRDKLIRFSYFNSSNTGNREGIPASDSQLRKQENYTGWDFEHVWTVTEGEYPVIDLRGEAAEIQISGNGSEENPYVITTQEQLFALAAGKLPLKGKYFYKLGSDIEITSANWTPIGGNGLDDFGASFDGQGHTISGLRIYGCNDADTGLFGRSTGTISNLTVSGSVEAVSDAGLLAGENAGTIIMCSADGSVASSGNHGGLVGNNVSGGIVERGISSASVRGTGTAGGLAGYNSGTVKESAATGTVAGGNSDTGGLVGYNDKQIENSYAAGTVSGTGNAGGLVGRNRAAVLNCYSKGKVKEGEGGGLIGYNSGGSITNSYYCSTTSYCSDTGKGVPLTKAEMLQTDSYTDWDFKDTWAMYETVNSGFPFHLWELSPASAEVRDFWYEVSESKKGFASVDQDMKLLLEADSSSTVEFSVSYVEEKAKKTTVIPAVYDETAGAFTAVFHIAENMQEISSLSAAVTDTEGNEKRVSFENSFWYQMPLKVEGILKVLLPENIAKNSAMTLKVFDRSGDCAAVSDMNGASELLVNALPENIYRAVLYGNGVEFESRENLIVTQGKTTSVNFTNAASVASVEIEFYSDGQKLSDKELEVNFFDKTPGKSRTLKKGTGIDVLSAGDKIGYSLYLSKDAKKKYLADNTVYETTLKAGKNVIPLEVTSFHSTAIALKVRDSVSGKAVGSASVSVSQVLNETYSFQTSGTSDSYGECNLKITDMPAEITVSRTGYRTETKAFTYEELQNGAEIILESQTGIVEFSLSYLENKLITDTSSTVQISSNAKPKKVELVREQTGERKNISLNSWPIIYIDGSDWEPGEKFTALVEKDGYVPASMEAAVNAYGNLYFAGNLKKLGELSISAEWEQGIASGNNQFVLFDAEGERYQYLSSTEKNILMKNLSAGNYTLAAADKSAGLLKYLSLQELNADEKMAGQWVSAQVSVEDGMIQETDVTIPFQSDAEHLIHEEESSILANTQYAMIGDGINIRANYVFNSIGVQKKRAVLTVPEGTRLIASSVTVNGQAADVTVVNNAFVVDTTENELLVRYSVKVLTTVTVSELLFAGQITYSYNGDSRTELLGQTSVQLNELTISVPGETNYSHLYASGAAPKNTVVGIYDDGVLIGQTTSNKYGSYRAEIELVPSGKNTIHHLKAATADGKESEIVSVQYGSRTATLLSFSIHYRNSIMTINNPTQGIGNFTESWNSTYPITFVARFDDNQGVSMVETVVSFTNGDSQDVKMTYNAMYDYWEGSVKLSSIMVPNGFDVEFLPIAFKSDSGDSTEEVTFLDSEVIGTQEEDDTIVCETLLTVDDANHTQVMSLEMVQKNVSFTPSEDYYSADLDGTIIYFKTEAAQYKYNGTLYDIIEYYMKMEDGTYALCRRGTGIQGSAFAAGSLFGSSKEKDARKTEEYEFAREMADLAAKSGDPELEYNAVVWNIWLNNADLAGNSVDAMDGCKTVVENDDPDSGLKPADKAYKKAQKEAEKAIDEMEQIARETEDKYINQVYEEMFNNEKFMKYLEEMANSDDPETKKKAKELQKKLEKMKKKYRAADAKFIVDPSGYVYETFEENRLEGVTAELYYENDEGYMEYWDAEEYGQINPQKTDQEGKYGWDVPEGIWQVIYSKDGYETTTSDKLEVPPPQLDVNIEMVSRESASIAAQSWERNRLTLVFDKYLQKASLAAGNISLTKNSVPVDAVLEINDNNVYSYHGTAVVKTVDLVLKSGVFEKGNYQVTIAPGIQTYYGISCGAIESQFAVLAGEEAETAYRITIPENVTVTRGDELLKDGDAVYCNDRLKITDKLEANQTLTGLTVNGEELSSGSYYTVNTADVVIDITFETELEKYTVSFNSKGGSIVADITDVTEGSTITAPSAPTKGGSVFDGWYKDEAYRIPWNFETDIVEEDLILYAKWKNSSYQIQLNQTSAHVYVGDTITLEVSVKADSEDTAIVWSSSDEEIASVTENGTVTARKAGKAEIKASVKGQENAYAVCVLTIEKKQQVITVTDSFTRKLGEELRLNAVLAEGNGALKYVSLDTSVAEVDAQGTVTLKKVGTAEIQITAEETDEYQETVKMVTVTVNESENPPVTPTVTPSVTPSVTPPVTPSVTPSVTPPVTPSVTPPVPQPCSHSYKPAVVKQASCEAAGIMRYTCTKCGASYDKAIPALGHAYGAWKVTKEATAVAAGIQQSVCSRCGDARQQSIAKLKPVLKLNATSITLKVKQSTTALKITTMQKGDSVLSWKSKNTKIATVSKSGKITGKKAGSTTITVKLKSGISKNIKVKVQKKEVAATKVTLNKKTISLKKGKSYTLKATASPITCIQKVKYQTSNKKVATVSSKGVIKAKGKGSAKITVTIGKKKAVCKVTVK